MLTQVAQPSLQGLFDGAVQVRAGKIHDCTARLDPRERAIVTHAVARRQQEFATGRLLARELLAAMGVDRAPLLSAVDRTPIWPDGIVGSIAHAGSLCVVAVARSEDARSIGVDVEPCEPLEEELIPIICSTAELEHATDHALTSKKIYCIKEAVYKCWYPLHRVPLEFSDVIVLPDDSGERFTARVTHAAGPIEMNGRIIVRDGWILASASIRAATVRERTVSSMKHGVNP